MVAYLDASVVLRLLLGEPGGLTRWDTFSGRVTSALTEVECRRTFDRIRLLRRLPDAILADRQRALYHTLETAGQLELSRSILRRAAEPFAVPLGTLDAIHLATALAWRDETGESPVMATHDAALGLAARAHGLEVIGVQ